MDGVVLDTEKLYTRFWKQAVEECGFHMTWEQLLGLRSLGQEYADAYFKGIDPGGRIPAGQHYRHRALSGYGYRTACKYDAGPGAG